MSVDLSDSLSSSSSSGSQRESATSIGWKALAYAAFVLPIPLVIYHVFRAVKIWRLGYRKGFLVYLHTLFAIAFVSLFFYGFHELGCTWAFLKDLDFICGPESGYWTAFVYNLSTFCINAVYALLGYYCRKELVFAKHGEIRWLSGHRFITAMTAALIAAGLVNFAVYNEYAAASWMGVLNYFPIVTACGSLVQIFILAATLNFSQRVMPFLSTKKLFAVAFLYLFGNLLGLSLSFPHYYPRGGKAAFEIISSAEIVCLNVSYYWLTWLFRGLPQTAPELDPETRSLLSVA